MPRAFSPREREAIRRSLIAAGKEQFARYGLRKTGIRDLTRAAGIADGSFYKFFASKEELLFEILELEEQAIKICSDSRPE